MCHHSKLDRLNQAAADLHKVSIEIRTFQDQQKALDLLQQVADRLSTLADQTEFGAIDLHLNVIKARNTATDAMVVMLTNDDLVVDDSNVAASLAVVARWHVQRAHRAAQRSQWGEGQGEASNG